MSLSSASVAELSAQLAAGEVSSAELVQASLDQIAAVDGEVQAYLHVFADDALAQAKQIDERRARGEELGPLAGVPISVKDVLCTRGRPTTCASKMLKDFRPPYDAAVVERLAAADAVIVGKTNMDEFAMGGSSDHSAFQLTRNPWKLACSPGGSSGGAAASVASATVPWALGTDTGGSVRQPAAFCGVTGLKPTYGRVSRWGLVAFASSLDQVGQFGRTVEDAALLFQAVAGHDDRDSTSLNEPVPDVAATLKKPLAGLKVGFVKEHFAAGLDAEVEASVKAALDVYRSLGAEIREVSLPHSKYSVATYYIIAPCEASSNLARYDGMHYGHRTDERAMLAELRAERDAARKGADVDSSLVRLYRKSRAEGFGPEVKRRIMLGTYALSAGYYDAYYLKALKVRRLIRQDFDAAFEQVDVIAGPTTAAPAFELGSKVDDPLSMYLVDLFTVSANLAGHAAISVPCGYAKSGLPLGLQLQAPPLAEESLLRAAYMYEQAAEWKRQTPALVASGKKA